MSRCSTTDALKLPKFDWNLHDQYEDFQLFRKSIESWYKLQGITDEDGDVHSLESIPAQHSFSLVGQKNIRVAPPMVPLLKLADKMSNSATEFMKLAT